MLLTSRTPHWSNMMFQLDAAPSINGWEPELFIACAGHFFSYGDFMFQQISNGCILHLVESGKGAFEMGGGRYETGAGEAFCFFPNKHIRYYDFPGSPWRFSWLHLGGAKAREALAAIGITEASPHAGGGLHKLLEGLMKEIQLNYSKPEVDPAFASCAAWRMMELLAGKSAAPRRDSPSRNLAEAAKYLIDNHCMAVLTIDEIAMQLQCDRTSLFRKFKAAYGISPKEHLDAVRIETAKRLLLASPCSGTELAALCGYSSGQYLSRAFKKRTGLPPAAWRKRNSSS